MPSSLLIASPVRPSFRYRYAISAIVLRDRCVPDRGVPVRSLKYFPQFLQWYFWMYGFDACPAFSMFVELQCGHFTLLPHLAFLIISAIFSLVRSGASVITRRILAHLFV